MHCVLLTHCALQRLSPKIRWWVGQGLGTISSPSDSLNGPAKINLAGSHSFTVVAVLFVVILLAPKIFCFVIWPEKRAIPCLRLIILVGI